MWVALRTMLRHRVVVSLVTTATLVGAVWAGWFAIRERFGEDRAALYAIVFPTVLVLVVIALTITLNRRHSALVTRFTGGTLTVVESDAPLGKGALLAAPWFREHGFEFAGSWCTALDGEPVAELLGSANHVRAADGVVALVGDGNVTFSTDLSDGRELVTANTVALALPGRVYQCVESGDLDTIDRVHTEGLAILAAAGVEPVPPAPLAISQLRNDVHTQSLVRGLRPATVRAMIEQNLANPVGTVADGGALHASLDASTADRRPAEG